MEFPLGHAYRNSFRWGAAVAFLAVCIGLAAAWPKVALDTAPLQPHLYNSWSCITGPGATTRPSLRVLGMSRTDAGSLAELCRSSAITERYREVALRWKTDDEARDATFLEMKYDILAVKPSRLRDEETGALGSYTEIAEYGPYECYLVGRDVAPRLDAGYFKGKRLGLGDPLSESSRRVLLGQFLRQDVAIDLDSLDCRGIAGHAALRDAFEAGEIDVFSSYWEEADSARFPNARRLLIKDMVKPVTWYVRSDLVDTEAHCEIVGMLESKARTSTQDYFKSLRVVRPCRK